MYRHIDGYVVDESTGEMLEYDIIPHSHPTTPLPVSRHYTESRDVEELNEIIKTYKEKRYSDVSYFLDKQRLGRWYVPLLKLCSKVSYFNVGFYDRKDIAEIFDIKESSINKTLNKLVAMKILKYTGKGLSKPTQVRVVWNPLSVWKGWMDSPTRYVAIQDWYKRYFTVDTTLIDNDVTLSSTFQPLDLPLVVSPDPYVSEWFNMMNKDRFNELMLLSDVDFELYLIETLQG